MPQSVREAPNKKGLTFGHCPIFGDPPSPSNSVSLGHFFPDFCGLSLNVLIKDFPKNAPKHLGTFSLILWIKSKCSYQKLPQKYPKKFVALFHRFLWINSKCSYQKLPQKCPKKSRAFFPRFLLIKSKCSYKKLPKKCPKIFGHALTPPFWTI